MTGFERSLAAQWPSLTPEQLARLGSHYELLVRWNRVLNLTTIRDELEVIRRHYVESLCLASVLPAGELRVADVGSGAGFPGIPVAIVHPECVVTLIESHRRKSVFLREASRGLPNVRVSTDRAERVSEEFDWIVSRAVRSRDVLKLVPRLARNVALLVSRDTPLVGGFLWADPVAVPGIEEHQVLCGSWAGSLPPRST